MMTHPILTVNRIDDMLRARVIVAVCAMAAVIGGAWAAASAFESASVILLIGIFSVAALILPRAWIPLVLAALIPLQFYFPVASGLNLRGALVFVVVAALRCLLYRIAAGNIWRWHTWMIPAVLFIVSASVSAVGAANRYAAFKGIYDWLLIFAAAFVVSESVQSERWLKRLIAGLVIAGVAEAMLGIVQASQSLSQIVQALQMPMSGIVYQPNLLRDRLTDVSFNWVLDGRVIPFGTLINAIDYAILLAAILPLGFALMLKARGGARKIFWAILTGVIGVALLMTFKGSGMIALAGALAVLMLFYLPRLDARARMIGLVFIIVGGFAALAFEPIAQRVLFLVQREAGMLSGVGRVAIWMQLFAALPQQLLFGFGLNNAIGLIDPLPSLRGGEFVLVLTAPESAYIAALVETGIVGFVLLLSFIGVVTWRAYLSARANNATLSTGVLAAIVALWFGNLTVTSIATDQNGMLFGILVGIIFASVNEHSSI